MSKNELERLSSLFDLDLDYTNLHDSFKDLTLLAAKITGTQISLISFIDAYTQWIISRFGLEMNYLNLENTVCQYILDEDDHLEIEDLSKDARFFDQSFIREPMQLRYYMGIPLKSSNGYNIGSLCVMDRNHQKLSDEKIEQLKVIARQIIDRINDANMIKSLEKKLNVQTDAYNKVAHDIRGPIAGIVGLAEMIASDEENYPNMELLQIVDMMGKSGQSVLELADEILKNAQANVPMPSEMFNLNIFKEKLETLYKSQAFNKNIDLTIAANNAMANVQIKKDKLMQIAGNLISNAIKFTPKGGAIKISLDLMVETDRKTLLLEVKDTGLGLSESTIAEILNQGTKSTSGTTGEQGYGLGLPSVMKLLDNLGGQMSIQSDLGKGSTFKVRVQV
ncbi:GAF domain-containing sensor histidine kinase [Nubsella zeaxanthinifaciens]|uniref:GAF domain-containing sensor histidine kinase n=1 Tax=Nubsella zeaxanthinifaciens TaxID=392412 RepID=UPI000DE2C201|nr:GAF domain-containing sensor histidine kinase [Nubsella zeaxanthinifaciens]